MKYITVFFMMLAIIGTASATSENITIVEPANDNPIINSDFDVNIFVNDTNVKYVQARITGFPWISLAQDTNTDWSVKFKIVDYPDGAATLTAKYQRTGESVWYYVTTTTPITIQKPIPSVQYGKVQFTLKDTNNNVVQGVTVQPSGNVSGSDGIITVGGQPLNQQINFSFTKIDYISTYYLLAFTNNLTVNQTITINKEKPDLKKFRVSGFQGIVEAPSMLYLRVRDDATGEQIDNAGVYTFKGNVVQNIPGNTTNGGRITVSFSEAGYFEVTIAKTGYEEWSDTITVIAPKVTPTPIPTPTQSPTPIPTPKEKYYPDANMKLTDDDYGKWLQRQDEIRRNQTIANNTVPTVVTPPEEPTNWMMYIGIVAIIGAVVYRVYPKGDKKYNVSRTPEIMDNPLFLNNPQNTSTKTIKCKSCQWTRQVLPDESDLIIKTMLEAHDKDKHGT